MRGRQLRRLVILQRHAMRRFVLADLKRAASDLYLRVAHHRATKPAALAGARRLGSGPPFDPFGCTRYAGAFGSGRRRGGTRRGAWVVFWSTQRPTSICRQKSSRFFFHAESRLVKRPRAWSARAECRLPQHRRHRRGRIIDKVCYNRSRCRVCPNEQRSSGLHPPCGRNDSLASFASRRVRGLNWPAPHWTRSYQQQRPFIREKPTGKRN